MRKHGMCSGFCRWCSFFEPFMIPRYQTTLRTGRVLQGYIVISIALLLLLLWFNAIFLLMATSLNRNARLQQENQLLFLQQQRYENLKAAIEEVRQARHDMRHQLNQITALAETGDPEGLKSYLEKPFPASRISVYTSAKTAQQIASSAIIVPWQSAKTFPFVQSSICRRLFQSMRLTCVWSCPTCWKMRSKPVSALHQTDGRLKSLHTCMPGGCF